MTALGWIFMVFSLVFVWSLTLWCFRKVLAAPEGPPEAAKDFHSA